MTRNISGLLASKLEKSLRLCFLEDRSTIPFKILANSIAGTYTWLMVYWFTGTIKYSSHEMANYIHRLSRAAVMEALDFKRANSQSTP